MLEICFHGMYSVFSSWSVGGSVASLVHEDNQYTTLVAAKCVGRRLETVGLVTRTYLSSHTEVYLDSNRDDGKATRQASPRSGHLSLYIEVHSHTSKTKHSKPADSVPQTEAYTNTPRFHSCAFENPLILHFENFSCLLL